MAPIVKFSGNIQFARGFGQSFKINDVPVDLDAMTVSDLRLMVQANAKRTYKMAALTGMYIGETQIDGTEQKDRMLLRDIPEILTHQEIQCNFQLRPLDYVSNDVIAAGGGLVGALAGPVVVQSAISAAGFGAGGIVAGTPAAALMASYGGSVGAGSAVAILQSIGAVGLGLGGIVGAAGVGGFLLYQGTRSLIGRN